jgi:hypothetical protein
VTFTTTHVGENVYDVACEIEDGPSRRMSYALPAGAGTMLSWAPELGRTLARFLWDELERRLYRHLSVRLLLRCVPPCEASPSRTGTGSSRWKQAQSSLRVEGGESPLRAESTASWAGKTTHDLRGSPSTGAGLATLRVLPQPRSRIAK